MKTIKLYVVVPAGCLSIIRVWDLHNQASVSYPEIKKANWLCPVCKKSSICEEKGKDVTTQA